MKLRKYAAHVQALEEEKAAAMDAVRQSGITVKGSDIEEALISICDRCVSLEQEIQNLRAGESRDSSNDIARLEEENLLLMRDLKKAKEDLRQAREEMEQLRVNAGGEPTLDLSLFDQNQETDSVSDGSKLSKSTTSSTPANNKRTIEVPTSKAGRPPLASISGNNKRKPIPSAEDKENAKNAAFGDVVPSESKRPRTRSSARKAPGLGESVLGQEESTAECKQS